MNTGGQFRVQYTRAILFAALAFVLTHGGQLFVVSFWTNRSAAIDPTSFLTLILFELTQFVVFVAVGWLLAFFPSKFVERVLHCRHPGYALCIACGAIIGLFFLPLCAGFAFFVFPEPDSPSYPMRCAEFGLPMTIAGAVGGYAFWRSELR
jgi:hypothetical protein